MMSLRHPEPDLGPSVGHPSSAGRRSAIVRSGLVTLLLPDPSLARRVIGTTTLLWLVFHLALAAFLIFAPPFRAALLIVGACALAVWADLRRHAGTLFYANLGISPHWAIGAAIILAGGLELVLQICIRYLVGANGTAFLG
jgi:hypothetical protein